MIALLNTPGIQKMGIRVCFSLKEIGIARPNIRIIMVRVDVFAAFQGIFLGK